MIAVFRADGSAFLGMGHIMRCLALAQEISATGRVIFVTRAGSEAPAVVAAEGFDVEELSADTPLADDAELTACISERVGADVVFTDVCHRLTLADRAALDAYHRALSARRFTVCLAGSDAVDIPADVVVSPYVRSVVPGTHDAAGTLLLAGPRYFILRREFAEPTARPRHIAHVGSRILVTVGGSDPAALTLHVMDALETVRSAEPMHVRVVVGPGFTPQLCGQLEQASHAVPARVELVRRANDLAAEMLWCDLAMTGDGLTRYETAATGTPSITLARPDSDRHMNEEFARAGTTLFLGDATRIPASMLAVRVSELLQDAASRERMSRLGRALVDAAGASRILTAIETRRHNEEHQYR